MIPLNFHLQDDISPTLLLTLIREILDCKSRETEDNVLHFIER